MLMLCTEMLVHSTEVVPWEEDFKVVSEVDADKQYRDGWLAEVGLTNLFHYGNEFGERNVRGDQVKAYHRFLTGDFGFWIMTREKPREVRSHPSGCLSLWNVQKKSMSILVTSPY